MTPDEYLTEVKRLGVSISPGCETAKSWMGVDRDGATQFVRKPYDLTPEQRRREVDDLRLRVYPLGQPN